MKDSTSAESRTTWEARTRTFWISNQRGPRRVRPGVLGPQRSRGVSKLNFYHQVQLRRQHLPAAQDAHHGGAQQHVRVAALVHRAGDARVVHFVETLHGLVAVVLSALQQVVRGHGAAVVVDVVAALAVGEDLDALDEAWGRRSSASWGSTARHAAPSRSWCCLFSACSPGSASAHPGLRR